ncbi:MULTISPECIES: hypothetical protein [Frankia]|uniref:Uncharacterized protein n=1 Tax=Frankia alni (strain DSM 45986 / CECT 9034 / ACN14a) TaxID=326424 RepID=Q0RM35_FRAAA|nr:MULTISPECIES: hypothetical protein [Frankia]CAJ61417.1 hypothetical protein FRAAL2773 [Frankia alni ACN14a]
MTGPYRAHPTEVELLRWYAARPGESHRIAESGLRDHLRNGAVELLDDAGLLVFQYPGWTITPAGQAFAANPLLLVTQVIGSLEYEASETIGSYCHYCCRIRTGMTMWKNCYGDALCDRCAKDKVHEPS